MSEPGPATTKSFLCTLITLDTVTRPLSGGTNEPPACLLLAHVFHQQDLFSSTSFEIHGPGTLVISRNTCSLFTLASRSRLSGRRQKTLSSLIKPVLDPILPEISLIAASEAFRRTFSAHIKPLPVSPVLHEARMLAWPFEAIGRLNTSYRILG